MTSQASLNRDENVIEKLISSAPFSHINEQPFHDEKLQEFLIRDLLTLYTNHPVIVTLTGAPGSGKSLLVEDLIKRLAANGHSAAAISTDGFGLFTRKERNEKIAQGASPIDVKDFELLRKIVEGIRSRKSVKSPVYHEETGDAIVAPESTWQVLPGDLHFLFVEGDFQPLENPDRKIYLHLPTDVRRENRVERDLAKREGYGHAEDIRRSFDYRLESQYYPFTLPHAAKADILILTKATPASKENIHKNIYTYAIYRRKSA